MSNCYLTLYTLKIQLSPKSTKIIDNNPENLSLMKNQLGCMAANVEMH